MKGLKKYDDKKTTIYDDSPLYVHKIQYPLAIPLKNKNI